MNRRDFIKKLFVGAAAVAAVAVVPLLPAAPIVEGVTPTEVPLIIEHPIVEIGQWEGFRWVEADKTLYFTNIDDPDNFGTVLHPSDLDETN